MKPAGRFTPYSSRALSESPFLSTSSPRVDTLILALNPLLVKPGVQVILEVLLISETSIALGAVVVHLVIMFLEL